LSGKALTVTPHLRNHPDFPLRLFTKCHACGTPLTGSSTSKVKKKYPYYRCRNKQCKAVNTPKQHVERAFVELLDSLKPKPEFCALFREVVSDVWRGKQGDAQQQQATLSRNIKDMRLRQDRLEKTYIFDEKISKETYERQGDKLSEEIALSEMALHQAKIEELDIDAVLGFAEHVLQDAARLWVSAELNIKQRLQRVLFPEGVTFDGERFGTSATCSMFSSSAVCETEKASLASPTGFEPVLPP
jgi:site-specific DNA recombinase